MTLNEIGGVRQVHFRTGNLNITCICLLALLNRFIDCFSPFGLTMPLVLKYIVIAVCIANVLHKYEAVTCKTTPKSEKNCITLNDLEL